MSSIIIIYFTKNQTCMMEPKPSLIPEYYYTDHPHLRGENAAMCAMTLSLDGPSPPAWGKQPNRQTIPPRFRTIPTRVGKTVWNMSTHLRLSDHPHPRGENTGNVAGIPLDHGPSPPAWGKPQHLVFSPFIPHYG